MTKQANPLVKAMTAPAEISATFPVMQQLRTHLKADSYVAEVQDMMAQGYRLAAVVDERVLAVAGYRLSTSLAFGKFLYIDDLVTLEDGRSRGSGKQLLDYLKEEARSNGCRELHLDSGVQRHGAHRFYLRERMDITCYHFRVIL